MGMGGLCSAWAEEQGASLGPEYTKTWKLQTGFSPGPVTPPAPLVPGL